MEAQPQNQFGTGPGLSHSSGTHPLEVDGDSRTFIKIMYRAFAMLYRKDPWRRLRPGHLFGLRVGQVSGWSQLFSCAQFYGEDGGRLGLLLFKSEQDAQNSLPVQNKLAPNVEILRVLYENEYQLDVSYKRMVTSLGLDRSGTNHYPIIDVLCSSSNGEQAILREPTMEELWYLVAFTRAITVLCSYFHLDIDKLTRNGRNMKPFRTRVNVWWPAELATIVEPVSVIISHPPSQINKAKIKSQLKDGISGTCILKIDGISHTFIKSLYRLFAALYHKNPWKQLRPEHLLGFHVGRHSDWPSKKQLFPCARFIGGDGGDLSLHLFRSEQNALKVPLSEKTKLAEIVEILRVTFEKENRLYGSNKKMVASLGLEPSGVNNYPIIDVAQGSSNGGEFRFRDPTMEELRYLFAVIQAITHPRFYPFSELDKDKVTKSGGIMNFKPFIIEVVVVCPAELETAMGTVAVTVSHPPNLIHGEKKLKSPVKPTGPSKDEEEFSDSGECAMCEKLIQLEHSFCCDKCNSIIYCGRECQNNHWREVHREKCHLYKSIMEGEKIFKFNLVVNNPCQWLESMGLHKKGMWKRICGCYSNCPFGLLPAECKSTSELWSGLGDGEYPEDRPVKIIVAGKQKFLSCWYQYYTIRDLSMRSPVAGVLSHALTVYYILTHVISSKNRLINGEEVIIHYLGPEVELDWMKSFTEISHLLNGLGIVKIFMVGPEVPKNVLGPVSGLGKSMRVYLYRGLYQEQIKNFPSPHLVIALNCELDSYDTWSGAIAVIKSMGVPVYFTERSEILCKRAVETLRINGFNPDHYPNPFRSPLQEQMPPNNVPSFRNGFLVGING